MPNHGFASIGSGVSSGMLPPSLPPTVAIGGDGGFKVMLAELETARRVGRGGLNPRNI